MMAPEIEQTPGGAATTLKVTGSPEVAVAATVKDAVRRRRSNQTGELVHLIELERTASRAPTSAGWADRT